MGSSSSRLSGCAFLFLVLLHLGCAPIQSKDSINARAPIGPLGEAKESAIEVCMPKGEHDYLSALMCSNGKRPIFSRSATSANGFLFHGISLRLRRID